MRFALLFLLAPPGSSAQTVCVTGFIMDTFCIERGTLLDDPGSRALIDGEGPQKHTYHCLLDVSQCVNSGFELLEAPLAGSDTYCRILRFTAIDGLLSFFRARGRAGGGCTTCTGTSGDELMGPSATVYGTISDASTNPPTMTVTMIRPPEEPCDPSLGEPYVPAVRNCASSELLPLFRLHGALMLCSWGFLLPLGVTIAMSGRHRDPLWFKVHRGVNYLGLLLALIGWAIALDNFTVLDTPDHGTTAHNHAVIGCAVMALGLLQPLNALLRPHKTKGEARSMGRLAWEVWHKGSGYAALILSIATISLGTKIISADNKKYQVSYAVLWAIVVCAGVYLKCVDKRFVAKVPTDEKGAEMAAVATEM